MIGQQMRLAAYCATAKKATSATISSREIGALLQMNPSQIRRDFVDIGVKGTRGRGYQVTDVVEGVNQQLASSWAVVMEQARLQRRLAVAILEMGAK